MRERAESGQLMAADVWLVGPVGLILGSNGSFSDAWVSLYLSNGTVLHRPPLIAVGCTWAKNTRRRKQSFILSHLIGVMIAALPIGSNGVSKPQILNIVTQLIYPCMTKIGKIGTTYRKTMGSMPPGAVQ